MNDGEKISKYMQDATSNLRSVGRNAVYAIIATAWALSIGKDIAPNLSILFSLFFAILYLAVDCFYFYRSAFKYKRILKKYFITKPDKEMQYINKNADKDKVDKETMQIMSFGACSIKWMFSFLILSFGFLLWSLTNMLLPLICNLQS